MQCETLLVIRMGGAACDDWVYPLQNNHIPLPVAKPLQIGQVEIWGRRSTRNPLPLLKMEIFEWLVNNDA